MQIYIFLLLIQCGLYTSIVLLSLKLITDHFQSFPAHDMTSLITPYSFCFDASNRRDFAEKLRITCYYYYMSQFIEVVIGSVIILFTRSKHRMPSTTPLFITTTNFLVRFLLSLFTLLHSVTYLGP